MLSYSCRTYATLISAASGRSRLQQVVEWLGGEGYEGLLVFDECHKAKNFAPGKEAQSTKVRVRACRNRTAARTQRLRLLEVTPSRAPPRP